MMIDASIVQAIPTFDQALDVMPGGVSSPVRAFRSVGGVPRIILSGQGAYLEDTEGCRYLDYVCGFGPAILGHAHPKVTQAVQEALLQGSCYGALCEQEIRLAMMIRAAMPNLEQVRFTNSGTEATATAIRLARGVTGRDKIIKFSGCYHGHADGLLVEAGSGALTCGVPTSPGVPRGVAQDTLIATYNDTDSVLQLVASHPGQIAAVIVEPMAANMNLVLPEAQFLAFLRELCDQIGALLIFDEVITGFRVHVGGAQTLYGVKPDLTTLGKIIGGGLPVGALGGRRELMEQLAPVGPVYQAGTLAGNPLTMTAGLATLSLLASPDFYANLMTKTLQLVDGLKEVARSQNVPLHVNVACGLIGLFFTAQEQVTRFTHVQQEHPERFRALYHKLLAEGIYLAPSPFEAAFISGAHGDAEINETLTAFERALAVKA